MKQETSLVIEIPRAHRSDRNLQYSSKYWRDQADAGKRAVPRGLRRYATSCPARFDTNFDSRQNIEGNHWRILFEVRRERRTTRIIIHREREPVDQPPRFAARLSYTESREHVLYIRTTLYKFASPCDLRTARTRRRHGDSRCPM